MTTHVANGGGVSSGEPRVDLNPEEADDLQRRMGLAGGVDGGNTQESRQTGGSPM